MLEEANFESKKCGKNFKILVKNYPLDLEENLSRTISCTIEKWSGNIIDISVAVDSSKRHISFHCNSEDAPSTQYLEYVLEELTKQYYKLAPI